jgi:hypothetical protein
LQWIEVEHAARGVVRQQGDQGRSPTACAQRTRQGRG